MSMSLEVVLDSAAVRIATSGPIVVVQFRDKVSAEVLRAVESSQERVHRTHRGGTLLLTMIDSSVPLPTEDARAVIVDTFKRMAARNRAAATVVRGDGFWASAIRSTLTALNLVVRPACPQRTYAEVDEAIEWLRSHDASATFDSRAVVSSIETLAPAT